MHSYLKVFHRVFCAIGLLFFVQAAYSQNSKPVQFSFSTRHVNDSIAYLQIKAKIAPGIKLFALQNSPEDLVYSTLSFDSSIKSKIAGKPDFEGNLHKEKDPALDGEIQFFTDSVVWNQPLLAKPTDSFLVIGKVDFMYKKGEDFPSGEEGFQEFVLPEANASTAELASINNAEASSTAKSSIATKSLWWIFGSGLLGGLLALITPCVYAMIPITVSFFTKKSNTSSEGIKNAVLYSLSIIFIFTCLGFLITIIFGPDALNIISTNWVANLIFFLIFVIFGISFLGAFDITLPSAVANKIDSKSNTGSIVGIFFMALTLVVVSFSCTGPILGSLLVLASEGSFYGPLVGMFGFSLTLGLPFAFFAFFPGLMNKLGKSGGWLNSVKVTLGFLELALALKFLSNADLAKGWRILDREVFISLWIVIFALLGFYLLGRLKFHHDDELPKNDFGHSYISITRLFLAIVSFSFVVYMVPGLFGAPLKKISAFVPPMGTQDFTLGGSSSSSAVIAGGSGEKNNSNILPQPVKFYDRMKMYEPEVVVKYGMVTYFDYNEALEVARRLKRPLMIDFTGINCVNCRAMEGKVWSDPEVMKRLKNDFVIVSLYVDVQNVYLPKNEQYYSESLKKTVKTIGEKSTDLQVSVYHANSQPFYFFLDGNQKRLMPDGYGYDTDVDKFRNMLDEVVAKYKASEQTVALKDQK
ncbi:MAG: thioredoxin family protein [Chitinophagaceae bacterium]|nr:thioredoxin family protein [Chitinophagaceae bacterium]